jgi:hypothetical protein
VRRVYICPLKICDTWCTDAGALSRSANHAVPISAEKRAPWHHTMTDPTDTYGARAILLPGLKRCWPDTQPFPDAIEQLTRVLADKPWGSLGYFTMPGSRFNDYWIEGGGDLWPQFGMFMHYADATEVALWFHDGAAPGGEPVVEIGGEGDLIVRAPNLEAFLIDWAEGRGNHGIARDPDSAEWSEESARALLAFATALPQPPVGLPPQSIDGFMGAFGAASLARFAADPLYQEIARVMDAHIPRDKGPGEPYNCQLFAAGDRLEVRTNFLPPDYTEAEPLPERDALIPLLIKAREARAQGIHAARGLWHCASLRISSDGTVNIPADWDEQPKFTTGGDVTAAEIRADLARYPRGAGWRPPWMTQLLGEA